MVDLVKKNTKIFVVEEAVEGVQDPASVGTEAVQILGDGFELTPTREALERSVMTGNIGKPTPRSGTRAVSSSIPCEMRASSTEGGVPDFDLLVKGALGSSRSVVTKTSSDLDGGTYSDTVICMETADIGVYAVGDILHIKRAGAHHISPITAIAGNDITLLVADPAGAFVDGLEVSAVTTYIPADTGHPSLSVEAWYEDVREETGSGCKVTSMGLNNFTTGQLADLSFGLEGMSYDQSIGTLGVTPAFQTSLPPVILGACVLVDGVKVEVNDLSFSLENTLGYITSTCSENGKIRSRVTDRTISGSFTPYRSGTDVDFYTKFNDQTSFSIFFYAYNPTGVAGEFNQVVAGYLPQVLISEFGASDSDGVVQSTISFQAHRGNSNDSDELFLGFI